MKRVVFFGGPLDGQILIVEGSKGFHRVMKFDDTIDLSDEQNDSKKLKHTEFVYSLIPSDKFGNHRGYERGSIDEISARNSAIMLGLIEDDE